MVNLKEMPGLFCGAIVIKAHCFFVIHVIHPVVSAGCIMSPERFGI